MRIKEAMQVFKLHGQEFECNEQHIKFQDGHERTEKHSALNSIKEAKLGV